LNPPHFEQIARCVYKVTGYAFFAIHSDLPVSNRLIVIKKNPIRLGEWYQQKHSFVCRFVNKFLGLSISLVEHRSVL